MIKGSHGSLDRVKVLESFYSLLHLNSICFISIGIILIESIKPRFSKDCISSVFQAFGNSNAIAVSYFSASSSSLHCHSGSSSIEGYRLSLKGKRSIVFQQNKAISRSNTREFPILQFQNSWFLCPTSFYDCLHFYTPYR